MNVEANAVTPKAKTGFFSNLAALKVGLDIDPSSGATEVLTSVPVRKGKKQEYFRIHPDSKMQLLTQTYENADERKSYIPTTEMREHLVGDLTYTHLHLGITRQGNLIVVPVKVPGEGETPSPWHETAKQAVELAKTGWVRMAADMSLGAYRIYKAEGDLPDPKWPDKSFSEILELAYQGKVIDNENHPVVQRLRGRI